MGPSHRENPWWPLVLLQIPPSPLPGEVVGCPRGWLRAGTVPALVQGYDLLPEMLLNLRNLAPCTDAGRQGRGNKGVITLF